MPSSRIPEPVRRRAENTQDRILAWGRANCREFAWRQPPLTPYRILVAEILLKRTTARAVAGSYEQFLSRYPTLASLHTATVNDLASMLAPLGLSSQRARAIRSMMDYLVDREDGDLPDSLEGLLGVPGLGAYSARAVLSFGWNKAAAVVDANVARILSRVFQRSRSLRSGPKALQAAADALLPREHREFNFAMLDLGAMVCRYARPACDVCPLGSLCDYNARRQPLEVSAQQTSGPAPGTRALARQAGRGGRCRKNDHRERGGRAHEANGADTFSACLRPGNPCLRGRSA